MESFRRTNEGTWADRDKRHYGSAQIISHRDLKTAIVSSRWSVRSLGRQKAGDSTQDIKKIKWREVGISWATVGYLGTMQQEKPRSLRIPRKGDAARRIEVYSAAYKLAWKQIPPDQKTRAAKYIFAHSCFYPAPT